MKIMIILSILGIHSLPLVGQKAEKSKVEAAVEQLKSAMITPDKKQLEDLILDELSYGHSSGKVEDKSSFIENLVNGNSDFVSIHLSDQQVIVSGKSAIVRHVLDAVTNDKGQPGSVRLHIMTVWSKQKGKWKLLARQAVKTNLP
ncbi:MAG: nuclear transport factor 2 family protein [Saprospiraceae bacterium]